LGAKVYKRRPGFPDYALGGGGPEPKKRQASKGKRVKHCLCEEETGLDRKSRIKGLSAATTGEYTRILLGKLNSKVNAKTSEGKIANTHSKDTLPRKVLKGTRDGRVWKAHTLFGTAAPQLGKCQLLGRQKLGTIARANKFNRDQAYNSKERWERKSRARAGQLGGKTKGRVKGYEAVQKTNDNTLAT